MLDTYLLILAPLAASVVAGGLIGFERELHGRPAGLRTHVLVCLASAALMLAPAHQELWLDGAQMELVQADPLRMAQGIMTGIGFLGAGAIVRSGMSVHGLTTAGSLWVTAGIGILFGIEFPEAAWIATVLALLVLTIFNRLEALTPADTHIDVTLSYRPGGAPTLEALRELARQMHGRVRMLGYGLDADGRVQHSLTFVGRNLEAQALIERLSSLEGVSGFEVRPR